MVNSLLAFVALVFLAGMLYIGYRVYKVTRFNDKLVLLLVALLNIDLGSKVFFYILNGYQEYAQTHDDDAPNDVMCIAMFLPVMFLSLAVTLNLRNWMYYFIRIGEMAFHHQSMHSETSGQSVDPRLLRIQRRSRAWLTAVNFGATFAMMFVGLYYVAIITVLIKSQDVARSVLLAEVFTGSLYTAHSLMFAYWGARILLRLKTYFREFYDENWKILLFATIGLSSSLLLRGVLDLTRVDGRVRAYLVSHENVFNIILFLFCDIIPICFQLSTLIFGYIRKRNEKKYRLSIQRHTSHQRESDLPQDQDRLGASSPFNFSNMSGSSALSFFDPPLFVNSH